VLGNRADGLLCRVAKGSWGFFQNLRTQDPHLNHDLERATREAYLLATAELLRQAEDRLIVSGAGARFLQAETREVIDRLQQELARDLRDEGNALPAPVADAHLFLLDPEVAPQARMTRLRAQLRENLDADIARWLGGEPAAQKTLLQKMMRKFGGQGSEEEQKHRVPRVIEDLLTSGWTIDTKYHRAVPRDWYSLIAIAFIEKLKSNTRLAAVFESKLLAEIAAREPAAACVGTLKGFVAEMDRLTAPLERIEDSLGILRKDVAEIKEGVRRIEDVLVDLTAQFAATAARDRGLAGEHEQRMFAELDRRDRDLRAMRSDLDRSEAERASILQQLEAVIAERAHLVETIAARDRTYAIEVDAYRTQIAGFADNPSEELQAALERFTDGDRVGAFPVIEALMRAQNLAAERATAARNAARLRELAALALQMKDKGEKSTADVAALWEEAQPLDGSHHWGWVELRRLYMEMGYLQKARTAAKSAVAASSSDRERSVSWNELGDVLVAQGDLAAARDRFSQSLTIDEKLARDNPSSAAAQRDLSVSFDRLGDVLVAQGDLAAACDRFSQSLTIDEKLARDNPSSAAAQRDLSVSFDRLGDVLVAQGDLAAARDRFSQSLTIREKLARDNPSSAAAQRDLIVSYTKLAQATGESEWWRRAFAVASTLQDQGRLAPQDAWMI